MSLDKYSGPKGAYYRPALVAAFADAAGAEEAIASLHAAGVTTQDIDVARGDAGVTVIVSAPTPGQLDQARQLLAASRAHEVRPYGTGADAV